MPSNRSVILGRRKKHPVIRFATGLALVVALATLSACGTTTRESGGGSFLPGDTPPPPGDGSTSSIIKSMRGGLIGGSVGAGLSEDEKTRALEAEYKALEYSQAGQPVAWKGDDERAVRGEAKAAQPYRVGSQDCRQYTQTVFREGQSRVARGTACRNSDGSWTPLT
jgi:surface antigen